MSKQIDPESVTRALQSLTDQTKDLFPRNGVMKDVGYAVAFFNDWEARDKAAKAFGTYEQGRFSFAGTVHGKWFACIK